MQSSHTLPIFEHDYDFTILTTRHYDQTVTMVPTYAQLGRHRWMLDEPGTGFPGLLGFMINTGPQLRSSRIHRMTGEECVEHQISASRGSRVVHPYFLVANSGKQIPKRLSSRMGMLCQWMETVCWQIKT